MISLPPELILTGRLLLVALAAQKIGQFFKWARLPLITGYLVVGILAGPFVFELVTKADVDSLLWIFQLSLAFIGFAAGGELSFKDFRDRIRHIRWTTIGLVVSTLFLGSSAVFLMSGTISFLRDFPPLGRLAVAILAGAILVARSPSSAIAIIKELRAKGPFTQTVLGVTVIMDAVVITLFAVNSSIADALLTNVALSLWILILLIGELLAAAALGMIVSQILNLLFRLKISQWIKSAGLLLTGYGVYVVSAIVRGYSKLHWSTEILIEPLLVCMLAGFLLTNKSPHKVEFQKILHRLSSPLFLIFFILVGAGMALDVLGSVWMIALVLFFVRLISIFLGSFFGGLVSGESVTYRRVSWMAYVTQAGVGLGLAQQVAVEFSAWGGQFATMMIAVIVLNQLVGPVLFKRALIWVKEALPPAKKSDPDQIPRAIIFGSAAQAVALARQLEAHAWQVKIVGPSEKYKDSSILSDRDFLSYKGASKKDLESYGLDHAGAAVMMMDDENNFIICKAVKQYFEQVHRVGVVTELSGAERFRELGMHVVNATTAMVSLLDHFVRSPSVVSLLWEYQEGQDVAELEMRNPYLHATMIKDLYLPQDTLFLGIRTGINVQMAKGRTLLHLGDYVTVMGSQAGLETVRQLFSDSGNLSSRAFIV